MIHFSALAFLGIHKFDEFVKLMLFNLIIMAEPTEQRSIRLRKPKIHFDDQIAESLGSSKPFKAPKGPTKPTEPTAQVGRRHNLLSHLVALRTIFLP
jgi:hypothetical protein